MPLSQFAPENYFTFLSEKEARMQALFKPFTSKVPDVFASPKTHFRYRAEFSIWHEGNEWDYVVFPKGNNSNPIKLNDFPIASLKINQLMPLLKSAISQDEVLSKKLFQIEFLTTLSGQALVTLIYHKKLDEPWEIKAKALAASLNIQLIGRSRKQKVVIDSDAVVETLTVGGDTIHYRQTEGGFTQPNPYINQSMLHWASTQLKQNQGDLLELYCGNGNFTLPLAQHFNQVIATEISKTSIYNAKWNCEKNGVSNIHFLRLSSEEFTSAMNKEREFRRMKEAQISLEDYNFNTLFVDPPRAGLDKDTLKLATRFDQILYISCNPTTLVENIRDLSKSHQMSTWAIFDQFPYTDHIETGVLLQKK
ncbi:MAG: tRNA (uridine(54)-C5)-methyltransferase TrmA [Cellvibrionales bacterium]|nr:tRNA (uridine(54)-C5)-methyltransferase TrmA [Cellvibrionales bacterium]